MLTVFLDGAFCQTVNDLKAFSRLLTFFRVQMFSFAARERYSRSNRQGCAKNLLSKSLKNTCEGGFFRLQVRNLQLYKKKKVNHRCSSRILVAPSAGSLKDSNIQVGSFVKHLLWP